MDGDLERQAPHGDTGIPHKKRASGWWFLGIVVAVVVVVTVCGFVPMLYYSVDTQYSVKIDSVSGIDPTAGLSFNLTLAVASRSHGAKACINPGMFAEVFYRGVQIAISEAEVGQLCAKPRKTAELHAVARASGVPVGDVLESLAAELEHGPAMFDVRLNVPENSYGGIAAMASWLAVCKATRVGDAAVLCESPIQA
jgi:hypothetical protein